MFWYIKLLYWSKKRIICTNKRIYDIAQNREKWFSEYYRRKWKRLSGFYGNKRQSAVSKKYENFEFEMLDLRKQYTFI